MQSLGVGKEKQKERVGEAEEEEEKKKMIRSKLNEDTVKITWKQSKKKQNEKLTIKSYYKIIL